MGKKKTIYVKDVEGNLSILESENDLLPGDEIITEKKYNELLEKQNKKPIKTEDVKEEKEVSKESDKNSIKEKKPNIFERIIGKSFDSVM